MLASLRGGGRRLGRGAAEPGPGACAVTGELTRVDPGRRSVAVKPTRAMRPEATAGTHADVEAAIGPRHAAGPRGGWCASASSSRDRVVLVLGEEAAGAGRAW